MWILNILRDAQERKLFIFSLLATVALVVVKIRFEIFPFLVGSPIAPVLTADATEDVVSDVLVGLLSAYIFYLFIEYFPRLRRESNTLVVLNLLLSSVIDAYNRVRMFGHEAQVSHSDISVLQRNRIKNLRDLLERQEGETIRLKSAMNTAHSRVSDFERSLGMASSLSPERALRWMVITQKLTLLAEVYEDYKSFWSDEEFSTRGSLRMMPFHNDMQFRFFEFVEQVYGWMYAESDGAIELIEAHKALGVEEVSKSQA